MAAKRGSDDQKLMRPALTPQGRENQLIALATDLAEKQLRDGTASAQVISHYIKMGSPREQQERRKMDFEEKLLQARTDNLAAVGRMEELVGDALKAFRQYAGHPDVDDDDE
jgi:hypothetical protein